MAAAYTEKEIDEIAAWLKEGLSAARIAGRFSALRSSPVSRNAIIGIVHRNAGLSAIGFANPKGGRAGGRPRQNAERPGRMSAGLATADLPPSGGDARQGRGGRCPADVSAYGVIAHADDTVTIPTPPKAKKAKAKKSARTLPPAWLAPGTREKSEAQLYKLPAPPPPVKPGRQPHVAAMRFLDCLFGRCRAPLDLALHEDAEDDAPGARPGSDMLCCGLRTSATRSYCAHHHARFHGRRMGAV
ncbi:GcrA cell cycle regulator [Mesorhizobium sp. B1-1-8]|uniref:GcrA cell cycle regulator n=1 Tax=Mesorhizobium sp. B1-1-8 TaxID=2589976 RepID=UPI001D005DBA|nr:GcrA cell cycle regulator [Mesorhizobium sp. B1-1-8]UCI06397.1 GcrA cell cycle regulator [Mesorhizobium sp. B1-1-8]